MATGDTTKNILDEVEKQIQKGQFKDGLEKKIQKAQQTDPNNKLIKSLRDKLTFLKREEDIINRYMENKEHNKALGHIDTILAQVNECVRVKLLKAECFAHLNEYDKAEDLLKAIDDSQKLKAIDDSQELKAIDDSQELEDKQMNIILVRALIEFNQGDLKKALEIANTGMKINKNHPKVKQLYFRVNYLQDQLEEAEKAVRNKSYQQAQSIYNEVAETINEDNKTGEYNRVLAKILKNKAETSLKMQAYIDAIADCERIISYGEFLDQAYAYLADAHIATGGMDIAAKVLKKSLENRNIDAKTRDKIETKLKEIESKKVDQPLKSLPETLKKLKNMQTPREMANVDANATVDDAVSRLTKLLARYSPDQYANKPDSYGNIASEIFELLNQARESLKRETTAGAKLKDLKDTFERMNSSKTPRQAFRMQDDAPKKEVEAVIKQLIRKYHPDTFTTPEEKQMAEEIFKRVREFQSILKKEK